MKKLRVIQIGTKHAHANGAFRTMLELDSIFEVAAVAEPDEEVRKKLYSDADYKNMHICDVEEALNIKNIDAAIIETDEKELTKYALMAAKKGLHIQMDKPGGENVFEFEELINELKKRNLVFQPGYMYRFNPAVVKAVEMVKKGELGDVFSVEAQMSIDAGEGFGESMKKFKGGITYFLGCHLIDILYKICGKPLEVIPLNCSSDGSDSINFGMAVYKYKNGVSFIKTVGNEINGFLRRQLVVNGTLGSVEIKPLERICEDDWYYVEPLMKVSLKKDSEHPNFEYASTVEFPRYKRYNEMFLNFAELIRGKGIRWCSYDDELEVFKLIMESVKK